MLRDARFWPSAAWISWGAPEGWSEGWAPNIVQGKAETYAGRASALLSRIARDAAHAAVEAEVDPSFRLMDVDERTRQAAESVVCEGQGTLRARVRDAYGRQCAVTGEHTEPVLDAAHIQRYLGPRSNHVQNGLLLTKEFHALFDAGSVGVTPDDRVRVSSASRARWSHGHRYHPNDAEPLAVLPASPAARPSPEALDGQLAHVSVAWSAWPRPPGRPRRTNALLRWRRARMGPHAASSTPARMACRWGWIEYELHTYKCPESRTCPDPFRPRA